MSEIKTMNHEISMAGIAVEELCYGHQGISLFDPLTFYIPRGHICAILGPNGTGKTTLLETLMGIIPALGGSIYQDAKPRFVAQHISNDIALSVKDVVLMGRASHIGVFHQPNSHDETQVTYWLEHLGIAHIAEHDYRSLSVGQRQLVMIARSLVSECAVLLLDEPMSALDIRRQKDVLELILRLKTENRMTVLFSTHEPQHAWAVDDYVLLLGPQKMWNFGRARTILTPERLTKLYNTNVKQLYDPLENQQFFVADFLA